MDHCDRLHCAVVVSQDLYKAEKEKRRLERKAKIAAFVSLLEKSSLTEGSVWEEVKAAPAVAEDPAFLALDEVDRLSTFKARSIC